MKLFSVACLIALVRRGQAIGQTLDGTPVGHQPEKDHAMESLAEHVNPQTGKVQHDHIVDYDAFIKHQTEPHEKPLDHVQTAKKAVAPVPETSTTQHASQATLPPPGTTHTNAEHVNQQQTVQSIVEEAHHPNHPEKGAAPGTKEAEKSGFEARRAEKEEKKKELIRHNQALAKYEQQLESHLKSEQAPPPTVGHFKTEVSTKNAVPIVDKDKTGEQRQAKRLSQQTITSTQAVILVAMLCILLIIALIVFAIGWVANLMLKMQKHEEQIQELTRQNTILRGAENDLEAGSIKSPKQAKGKNKLIGKKEEAYGRFEDEIQISQDGSFRETEKAGSPQGQDVIR